MANASYRQLFLQSQDPNFLSRVQEGLLQTALNVKMEAMPASGNTTLVDREDRLARSIVAAPAFWASQFAFAVAIQLIAKSTLLDENVTTDADIFSAIGAVYDKYLPST